MTKKIGKQKGEPASRGLGGSQGRLAPIDEALAGMAQGNVAAVLKEGRIRQAALELARSAFYLASFSIRKAEAEGQLPREIACREGCDPCCYNLVEVTAPEAVLLGDFVARNFSPAEQEALLARVAGALALMAGQSKTEIIKRRRELPCPLLREGRCSVYPVRPLVCRAMHAFDAGQCRRELAAGSLAGGDYYAHPHSITLSVASGLLAGCREAGLQPGPLNLTRALHDFFTQTEPVDRWLQGKQVFFP
jgi:Fe-S-cluster containining protein